VMTDPIDHSVGLETVCRRGADCRCDHDRTGSLRATAADCRADHVVVLSTCGASALHPATPAALELPWTARRRPAAGRAPGT
jgi:hypothetical protein